MYFCQLKFIYKGKIPVNLNFSSVKFVLIRAIRVFNHKPQTISITIRFLWKDLQN